MSRSDTVPAEPAFRIETHRRESRDLLVFAGQIGLDAAAPLHDQANHLAASGYDVDVDWREAESVTAGCFQVLLALGFSLSEQGRTLRVTGDNPKVRHFLDLAGLSERFPVPEAIA